MISLLAAAAAAAVVPKLVSFPDFALGCRRRLVIFLPAFDADAAIRCYKMTQVLLTFFHPFSGFEWDVSQACLPLLPCYPTFLEVLSGVYAGIISFSFQLIW